jgi:hypothetical protein
MKSKILLTIIMFWSLSIVPMLAQNNIEKTLVKSFNLNGKTMIKVDLPNVVEVKTWNDPIARIEMNIAVENIGEPMLKSLIVAGRYNISTTYDANQMLLSSPAMQRTVKVNGQEIKETVRYTLFVPSDVAVTQGNAVGKVQ